MTDPAVG